MESWIHKCAVCGSRNKGPGCRVQASSQSIPVGGPFEMVAMDFVGPLTETESGNRYLLLIAVLSGAK